MKKELKTNLHDVMPHIQYFKKVGAEHVMCRFKWDYPIVNFMSGHIRMCCRVPKQVVTEEDIEKYGTDVIMNLPYELERRKEKLLGITHEDCVSCLHLEHCGASAPRSGIDDFMKAYWYRREQKSGDLDAYDDFHAKIVSEDIPLDSPLLKSSHPEMLEIVLGNSCDLKCTYCSVHYSSQWATELIENNEMTVEQYEKEFPTAPNKLEKVFWEWFYDVGRHSVMTINILGGEPTYMKQFYTTMEKLVAAYDDLDKKPDYIVELGIISNMNTREANLNRFINYMPELARHFRLRLQPSIEAMGKRAEYIRFNLDWNRFEGNVRKVLQASKDLNLNPDQFMMGFQIAINTFSISSLPEFIHWINDLNKEYGVELGLMKNVVSFPRHHNPNILTPEFANYVASAIEYIKLFEEENDLIASTQRFYGSWKSYRVDLLEGLYESMSNPNKDPFLLESRQEFLKFIKENDRRRGCNFHETYPEYADFIKHCEREAGPR